jgi:LacI family transcriptional regulator
VEKLANKKVKLKDIAELTGFAINTVSKALQDKKEISLPTRRLIQETARQIGYIGNSLASSLRSGITKTIAVIVGDISNPHFGIAIKEIETSARAYNYTIFVINTEENEELEERAIRLALSKNVDGILICPTQSSIENIRLIQQFRIPFVLFGRRFQPQEEMDYVICDDIHGGYVATKHLIEKGRSKILFLNAPKRISSAQDRLEGYRKALDDAGLLYDPELVKQIHVTTGSTHRIVAGLVKKELIFDAIFAFSDIVAWEAIHILNRKGYRVPEDISVVGFDNIQARFYFPVLLTTVSDSKGAMSRRAFEILIQKIIEAPSQHYYNEILETHLIIRSST